MSAQHRWFIALTVLCASGCVLPRIERWEPDGAADDRVVVGDAPTDGAFDAPTADTGVVDAADASAPLDVVDAGVDTGADAGVCAPGQLRCGAVCVSTQSDPANCGSCGNVCPTTASMCTGGMCRATCRPSETNCSGACVELQTSVAHCGMCGRACVAPSGGIVCSAGTCAISGCPGGIADCDGRFENGCEINTTNDANNCGSCGFRCPAPSGGSTSCVAGACRPTCPPGLMLDAMTMRCVSGCGATTACASATDCPAAVCGTALFAVPWSSLTPCSLAGFGMASPTSIQECTTAARVACSARGYSRGGWGPIAGDSVSATIVCESATYAPAPTTSVAVVVTVDGARLCGPASQWGNNCTAAIVDACLGRGGFGTTELAGTMAIGVCHPNTRTTMITIPNASLPAACVSMSNQDFARRSNGCLTRLAEECRRMVPGSIAAAGPVRDEASPTSSFVWCVRPTI
ncbi:MAG: hypothetical protein JNK05_40720 [Myxococcales bacterium]|nr:hypothetical protein [Myxococcales bacterium]